MYIHDNFIFLHIPKTGGQSILRFLNEIINTNNKAQTYHGTLDSIPEQHQYLPKFAVIRNPWDWYVSWFAFHKKLFERKEGTAIYKVASNNNTLGFKQTTINLLNLCDDPESLSKIMKYKEHYIHQEKHLGHYLDEFDIFDTHKYGFYSHQVNKIISHDIDDVEFAKLENFTDDVLNILTQYMNLTDNQIEYFKQIKENTSPRLHYREYYDTELKELIDEKDKELIEHFKYKY